MSYYTSIERARMRSRGERIKISPQEIETLLSEVNEKDKRIFMGIVNFARTEEGVLDEREYIETEFKKYLDGYYTGEDNKQEEKETENKRKYTPKKNKYFDEKLHAYVQFHSDGHRTITPDWIEHPEKYEDRNNLPEYVLNDEQKRERLDNNYWLNYTAEQKKKFISDSWYSDNEVIKYFKKQSKKMKNPDTYIKWIFLESNATPSKIMKAEKNMRKLGHDDYYYQNLGGNQTYVYEFKN